MGLLDDWRRCRGKTEDAAPRYTDQICNLVRRITGPSQAVNLEASGLAANERFVVTADEDAFRERTL